MIPVLALIRFFRSQGEALSKLKLAEVPRQGNPRHFPGLFAGCAKIEFVRGVFPKLLFFEVPAAPSLELFWNRGYLAAPFLPVKWLSCRLAALWIARPLPRPEGTLLVKVAVRAVKLCYSGVRQHRRLPFGTEATDFAQAGSGKVSRLTMRAPASIEC